jgi:UDP-glucose 4-epimerase
MDIIKIHKRVDESSLGVLNLSEAPFDVKRFFYITSGSKTNCVRGKHAHYKCRQILICLSGLVEVSYENADGKNFVNLNPGENFLHENLEWVVLNLKEKNTVLLSLCSEEHQEEDYIHDYNVFKKEIDKIVAEKNEEKNLKVLITGCAGLFGANFSRHLLKKGYDVVGIDNLSGGYHASVPEDVKFYQTDLEDRKLTEEIFARERPDFVYHFAAYASEGLSRFVRNYNYTSNVLCSANVINACINNSVKKLVFTSSMAVYGFGEPPFKEDQTPKPDDPYGVAKYAVEMDLAIANKMFGLNYSIVRPHNVVGLYQNIWDRYRNVIGIWIRQVLNNEPITVFGDGSQIRAFSDINFCMEPLEKLIKDEKTNGQIYNIGSDEYCTIDEAADLLIEILKSRGHEPKKVYMAKREEVHVAYCDHNKAKKHLNFVDETSLRNVIEKMADWADEQPERPVKDLEYEIEKKIYDYWATKTK